MGGGAVLVRPVSHRRLGVLLQVCLVRQAVHVAENEGSVSVKGGAAHEGAAVIGDY